AELAAPIAAPCPHGTVRQGDERMLRAAGDHVGVRGPGCEEQKQDDQRGMDCFPQTGTPITIGRDTTDTRRPRRLDVNRQGNSKSKEKVVNPPTMVHAADSGASSSRERAVEQEARKLSGTLLKCKSFAQEKFASGAR